MICGPFVIPDSKVHGANMGLIWGRQDPMNLAITDVYWKTVFRLLSWCSWFHGDLKRQQAEELLQPREDGMFLVRESTNFPGDYTLCLCGEGNVEHYHIMCEENKLTIDEDTFFENLHQLVEVSLVS